MAVLSRNSHGSPLDIVNMFTLEYVDATVYETFLDCAFSIWPEGKDYGTCYCAIVASAACP